MQSALSVGGRGREVCVLLTCSLQSAKAGSDATLPQQEMNTRKIYSGTEGIITGFICKVAV